MQHSTTNTPSGPSCFQRVVMDAVDYGWFQGGWSQRRSSFLPDGSSQILLSSGRWSFLLDGLSRAGARLRQGTSSETTEQFPPRGEELQRWSPSSNVVTILLDCDGHHGHRGNSLTQRSRTPWTVTAIVVTTATRFPGDSSTSWTVAALEVITANSVISVP